MVQLASKPVRANHSEMAAYDVFGSFAFKISTSIWSRFMGMHFHVAGNFQT